MSSDLIRSSYLVRSPVKQLQSALSPRLVLRAGLSGSLFLVQSLAIASQLGFALDDAWLHTQYADLTRRSDPFEPVFGYTYAGPKETLGGPVTIVHRCHWEAK